MVPPAQALAGSSINVSWEVVNSGVQATSETAWQDGVYLSQDTDFTPNSDIELAVVPHNGPVPAGGRYSATQAVALRQDLEGDYYVYVVADARHQVFEHTAEENNTTAAPTLLAVAGVHADLQITSFQAPSAGIAGAAAQLIWQVSNLGRDATPASAWSDSVYLSADAALDDADTVLGTFQHNGLLDPGGFYWQDCQVRLPDGLTGPFFLIVKTNSGLAGQVYEYRAEDNNTAGAAINLSLAPPADLQVTAVSTPATAWSGQAVDVTWTVTNQGAAAAQSLSGNWYDNVYLSRDQYLDVKTDVSLGTFQHQGALAANGGAYTQTVAARLPAGISGPYYVFVWTDSNERVPERGGEENNVTAAAGQLQVNLTPPSDLQVTSITPPLSGNLGQPATWTYRVDNMDTDAAYGAWYDTIYVSADNQWDINDARVARVYHQGDVPHAGYYEETVTANVPGVVPGDYFVIVRTDILNTIREKDETNNTTVAAALIHLEAAALPFDQDAAGTIVDQQALYYRLQPNAGDDVVITLSGQAAAGAELYLARGTVPTRNNYDVRSSRVAGTQQLRLPAAEAADYYLLIFRDQPGLAQNWQLAARRLDFSVTGVSPNRGGNVGSLTVQITGGQLPEQPLARLVGPLGAALYASRVYPGDGTGFYATFDLAGQTPGSFDVEVGRPDGTWAAADDAFTVVPGVGANLQATLNLPTLVRARAPFSLTVEYVNTGDIDMPAPLLRVAGPAGLSLGFRPGKLDQPGDVLFLAPSASGPAGILRPGEKQTLTLYSLATDGASAHYTLTSQSVDPVHPSQELIDWNALAKDFRPAFGADSEAWQAQYRLFTRQVGATWDEVLTTLSEYATDVGRDHLPSLVADDLLQEQFRLALSRGGGLTDWELPWIMSHTPGFNAVGAATYLDIDFSEDILPASFTTADVAITGPAGQAITPDGVVALNSRTYRIEFPAQSLPGRYAVAVGPDIEDLVAQPLDQDRDGQGAEAPDDIYQAGFVLAAAGGPQTVLYVTGQMPAAVSSDQGLDQVALTFSQPVLWYSFTTADVALTGPAGPVAVAAVQRLSGTQFQVHFPRQTAPGSYQLTVGPEVLGLDARAMDQNLNGQAGEAGDSYRGTWEIFVAAGASPPGDPQDLQGAGEGTPTVRIKGTVNGTGTHVRLQVWEENGGAQDLHSRGRGRCLDPGSDHDGHRRVRLHRRQRRPGGRRHARHLPHRPGREHVRQGGGSHPGDDHRPGHHQRLDDPHPRHRLEPALRQRSTTSANVGETYTTTFTLTNEAFSAAERIYNAGQWFKTQTAWSRSIVPVLFPYSDWAYFAPSDTVNGVAVKDCIEIKAGMTDNYTLGHEYGHAIHYELLGGGNLPGGGGSHTVVSVKDTGFALTEGWAQFVGAGVINGTPSTFNWTGQTIDTNEFWMGNGYATGIREVTAGTAANGKIVEGAVASILWDILDPAGDDSVNNGIAALWTAFKAAHDSTTSLYSKLPENRAYQTLLIDNGVDATDDTYEPNDTAAAASDLGSIDSPESEDGLIMAEEAVGSADWYKFKLPKLEDDDSKRKNYTLKVTLQFKGSYGDLDLLVTNKTGGVKKYDVQRSGDAATVEFADLWNNKEYQFEICAAGFGLLSATGDVQANQGGDYNPDYKLIIDATVPEPEDDEDDEDDDDQGTGGTHDPNDKLGPAGFGAERYLTADCAAALHDPL